MNKIKLCLMAFSMVMIAALAACTSLPDNSSTIESTPKTSYPPVITTPVSHNYFKEGPEFSHSITNALNALIGGSPGNDPPIKAKYIRQNVNNSDARRPLIVYQFETTDTGAQINVQIPIGIADNIKLNPGTIYQIVSQVLSGWPSIFGLIISQDAEVVFVGITDWQIDGYITIDDAFLRISSPSIKVEQTRVLTDHYIDNLYNKMTNTEIKFSFEGKSVTIHQGELSLIGDYQINLLIAREVQYKPGGPTDSGVNKISYTICRVSESTHATNKAPAYEAVNFPDPALDSAIRKAIKISSGNILRLNLVGVTAIGVQNQNITNLTGLENCTALTWLSLPDNRIEDISLVSNLTNVRFLDLHSNKISSIYALTKLDKLKQVYLYNNPLDEQSINVYIPQLKQRGVQINP